VTKQLLLTDISLTSASSNVCLVAYLDFSDIKYSSLTVHVEFNLVTN